VTGVFADSCEDYARAGWPCIIPVPAEAKFPPPEGFTGAAGKNTPPEQLAVWADSAYAGYSVALRMPDGVIGIDVDHYEKNGSSKRGDDTLAEREAQWGALPLTWCSTARGTDSGPGPARIMFYRVPAGRYATKLGPDIDIIQNHHRYAVVAPSPHPGTGTNYRWYGPDGLPSAVPSPEALPELPASWVARLAEGAAPAGPMAAGLEAGQALLSQLLADRMHPCAEMDNAGKAALAELSGALPGSRHDVMTSHVYHIVQLGAEGHPGPGWVLSEWLAARWGELTSGENRDLEFDRLMLTAARKAVTALGGEARVGRDPCLTARPLGWDFPAPDGIDPGPDGTPEPPRQWSPREAWGAWLFETDGQLDSTLGRDVLSRTYPGLRYAADAGTWLIRGPLKWESRKGEQAKWAVEEMFWLMPRGDPGAPEGSDDKLQATRRARFGTTAGANAVAGKMTAQVSSGHHPCALEMADLDQDAEIMWAGGVAWDLRASADYPVIATRIDPGSPHMHTAAYVPEQRDTPLWDAFLAAVWPEEEMRRWALRVLSIAFTGHPDKALPLLLGATDRGKTEVVNMLASVLGTYALKSADARLLSAADRSHASIVYALKGRRLAFIDEAPRAGHLAQERLKSLTGGAELTGNRMGENPITFAPTHTLILTANPDNEPALTDPAVRRRVRLLTCDGDPEQVRVARAAIGFLSRPQWRAEAPGVLAAMMVEASAWLADPLSADNRAAPESARKAAELIAIGQDSVFSWVADSCAHHPSGTRARMLYESFVGWCKNNAIPQPPTETRWGRRLTELGFPPVERRDGRYRLLRIRGAGEAVPAVEGWTPFVEGLVEGSDQTLHTQNPRSNYPQLSTVEGVDSRHTHNTHTPAHTHTHIRKEGTLKLSTPSSTLNIAGQTGCALTQPSTEPSATINIAGQTGFALMQPPMGPENPPQPSAPVVFDLETGDAGDLFTYAPHDDAGFVRLAGMLDPNGRPAIVAVPELLARLDAAAEITGHNILGFDLLALARHHGADWDALAAKARDTELIARQADPPRSRETGGALDAYDLDSVAARLGLPGKTDSLARLKREHGGYDKIPLDDPEYRAYLEGDLRASAAVIAAMRERYPADPYVDREHVLAALAGRMTLNGFAVDRELLDTRLAEGENRKREALSLLHDGWGLPLGRTVMRGRGNNKAEQFQIAESPLATDFGRAWLAEFWERYQIPDPPRTAKAGKLAIGSDDLKAIANRPECPGDLKAALSLMGIVTGTRTVYQTAFNCLCADGRVHPTVSMRQASGRWSVTNPGLTVFGKRGGRHHERDIFLPDSGHILLSFDLSQVDMRGMAWLSGDHAYRALFAPGRDAHAEIARQVGIERQDAKAIGHGWNYGLGAKRMIANGLDPGLVHAFTTGMEQRFPTLIAWREQIREQGKAGAVLENGFGRRMRCDQARAYTVAPALMGQGSARDIMCQSLLRLPREVWPMLRVMVHDEIVCSVPKQDAMEVARVVMQAMTWQLDDDLPVLCDMAGGATWGEASAK
jgi:hypothetical protein